MDGLEDVDINYKSFKMEHPFNVSSSGKVYFIIMFLSLFIFFMHNNSCYFFQNVDKRYLIFLHMEIMKDVLLLKTPTSAQNARMYLIVNSVEIFY